MHTLLSSASLVAIAEMGDKTQLLAMLLAARYRCFFPIFWGVLIATLLNHAGAAYAGVWLAEWLSSGMVGMVSSGLFVMLGLWLLVPDNAPECDAPLPARGAFLGSLIAFFIAEMGDKTQIATITLGAQQTHTLWVIAGTTLGMMVANAPAILFGEKLLNLIPAQKMRMLACLLFIGYGGWGLWDYWQMREHHSPAVTSSNNS